MAEKIHSLGSSKTTVSEVGINLSTSRYSINETLRQLSHVPYIFKSYVLVINSFNNNCHQNKQNR